MIRGIIGRRGRGKTTLAYFYAKKVSRRVIFDPRGLIETGVPRVENRQQLEATFDALNDGAITEIVVTPFSNVKGMFSVTCVEIQTYLRDHPDARLAFLIDESRFVDLEIEPFDWIVRCAPREQVEVIITCHRPIDDEFPVSVQAILDYWLIFHSTQDHDLRTIAKRCGDRVARHVSQLSGHAYVEWNDGEAVATIHHDQDKSEWFVPLTPRHTHEPIEPLKGSPIETATSGRLFEC